MTRLIILGSSNAVATEDHENTHMVILGDQNAIMIDCVSSPILRLRKAGVDFHLLSDIILTHFHPDHVSGLPLLLMDMWLMGRRAPLRILGLKYTLERAKALMGLYGWGSWPDFYPVTFENVPEEQKSTIIESRSIRVISSPVRHLIPTIGLRIESSRNGRVIVYSCDTEPCPEVVNLAAGANVLIHEAAGAGRGHSSAAQAGEIAREAEVERLLLIHYPAHPEVPDEWISAAKRMYGGDVALASDYLELDLD